MEINQSVNFELKNLPGQLLHENGQTFLIVVFKPGKVLLQKFDKLKHAGFVSWQTPNWVNSKIQKKDRKISE